MKCGQPLRRPEHREVHIPAPEATDSGVLIKLKQIRTPFEVFFLAFHSSSWAFVLASTFTKRFLSPICRSWSSLRERSVDSGSLYSQNPNAATNIQKYILGWIKIWPIIVWKDIKYRWIIPGWFKVKMSFMCIVWPKDALSVRIMDYLEACQRLLELSSSSEQFHISTTLAQREKKSSWVKQMWIYIKYHSTGFSLTKLSTQCCYKILFHAQKPFFLT